MKLLTAVLALLCLGPQALQAGAGGFEWKIVLSSGDTLDDCRQLAVSDSLLSFHRRGLAGSVTLDSVASLIRVKDSRLLAGAGVGLAVGAGLGMVVGGSLAPSSSESGMQNIGTGLAIIGSIVTLAAGGTLIGAISGGLAGRDEVYRLNNKTSAGKAGVILKALGESQAAKQEEAKRREAEKEIQLSVEREKEVAKRLEESRAIGTDPEPLEMAAAEYPEAAREAGVTGKVFIKVVVGPDGLPRSAEVLKGIGSGCDQTAREAAMSSTFRPGTDHGKPAEKAITVIFNFPQ